MENSSLWIPTAIHKLPNQVKGGRGGRGGEREKVIARTKLTDALSGILLAPAQELFTCISFFYNHMFWFILKIIYFFYFFEKLVDTTISWSNGQVKGSPCIYMLP